VIFTEEKWPVNLVSEHVESKKMAVFSERVERFRSHSKKKKKEKRYDGSPSYREMLSLLSFLFFPMEKSS
jgi:hypothetical protein